MREYDFVVRFKFQIRRSKLKESRIKCWENKWMKSIKSRQKNDL